MKYLKLFENFEDGNPDYYQQLEMSDFSNDVQFLKCIPVNSVDIDKLKELLSQLYPFGQSTNDAEIIPPNIQMSPRIVPTRVSNYQYTNFTSNNILHTIKLNGKMFIYKMEDEWFYFSDWQNHVFWKCDQLDGLIKCLEDNY